jgi:4-hydroxy-tetrahydrodipicolinate reductase
VDHPSGTARRLAELVVGSVGRKERWAEGPAPGPADPATLWVSTTRAGEIPGSHVLAAEGPDDRIELRHDARSRAGFARGAVTAAEWIRGRSGVFTLDDVLEDLFQEDTP